MRDDALLFGAGAALQARPTAEIPRHLMSHRVELYLTFLLHIQVVLLLLVVVVFVIEATHIAVRHNFVKDFVEVVYGRRFLEMSRIDSFLVTLGDGMYAGFACLLIGVILVIAAIGEDEANLRGLPTKFVCYTLISNLVQFEGQGSPIAALAFFFVFGSMSHLFLPDEEPVVP